MGSTPRDKSIERAEAGRNIAASIRDAIAAKLPSDANVLAVLSHRIEQCNSPGNLWHGRDLHNEFGEAYDGSGRFWQCGSKLCPDCVAKQSRRVRRMLRHVMQEEKMLVGTHHHFLTLTMPTQDLSLLESRAILNHAWSVFRKKKWFTTNVKGGFRSEEFTLNATGFHYHMHVLCTSRFINYDSFRHFWSEALHYAFEQAGLELKTGFTDGTVWAHCTRVWSRERAIKEVAKYITKSDSWQKLDSRDLLDVCRIERWPRMVEFFGEWKSFLSGVSVPKDDDGANKTILDTGSITDRSPARTWRDDVRERGAAKYLADLESQILDESLFRQDQLRRKYTAAKLSRCRSPIKATIESTIALIRQTDTRRDGAPFSTNSFTSNGVGGFVCTETGRILDYFDGWTPQSVKRAMSSSKGETSLRAKQ
jgi:hypothetical protein